MNLKYNRPKLIKLIKALPLAVAVFFSCITTYLVVNNNIQKHKENIQNIKTDFLENQKIIIKKEVIRTLKHIRYQKNIAEQKLKTDIKSNIDNVTKIIYNIYKENSHKTKREITKLIKDAIRPISYNNGRGYYFIYKMNGVNILYPPSPQFEGEDMSNIKDSNGIYNIQKLAKLAAEKTEGYFSWYWFKPNSILPKDKKMYKKIGYIRYIKELDWFIGTGEYIQEFENDIKNELIKEIQEIRFGGDGYIFMHQYDGVVLTHIDTQKIGKNFIELQNESGKYIVKDIIEVAKKGSGFIEYTIPQRATDKRGERKLSYIVGLDDWQWQIGAGTYLSNINKVVTKRELEFKEKLYSSLISIVISSVFLTLVLIYIMLKLLTIIEAEFAKYEKALSDHIFESHKKDKLLSEQGKLASMGEMIANIAHQWRQPLSVISTAATGMKMQKEFGCLPDDIFNNSCDAINNNAQYLSSTIDDFKNFIKGDSSTTTFDVTHTIKSFLHLVEGTIKTHNIDVILDLEKNLVVTGYENQMLQCLMNIFNNAKDAFELNKVKNKEFYIVLKKETSVYTLELKDNAGGIPKKILSKIFEPYFTTKHKSQGTGLGLHMTYNLITQGMNGKIVASNSNFKDTSGQDVNGAVFTITLPLEKI